MCHSSHWCDAVDLSILTITMCPWKKTAHGTLVGLTISVFTISLNVVNIVCSWSCPRPILHPISLLSSCTPTPITSSFTGGLSLGSEVSLQNEGFIEAQMALHFSWDRNSLVLKLIHPLGNKAKHSPATHSPLNIARSLREPYSTP